MTFKHVKFEDSPIMRSLEKVAQEKGLIKPQPLNKTAAAKMTDLTPTTSLLDNVLKLCAGLRERGFEKQANELEVYLVNYKKAQTLYETSPEKGEDLVHAAHPKGSHKLEGVDADEAVVEDILDQYAKSLEMINKKPTGKLSSAKEAIEAVKVTLGARPLVLKEAQDAPKPTRDLSKLPADQLEKLISSNVARAVGAIDKVGQIVKDEMTAYVDFATKQKAIQEASRDTKIDNLNEMVSQIEAIKTRISPSSWFHYVSFGASGITENTWAIVEPMLNGAESLVNEARRARRLLLGQQGAAITKSFEDGGTEGSDQNDPVIQAYNDAIKTIGLLKARIRAKNLSNGQELMEWLDAQALPFAKNNLDAYSKSEYKNDKQVADSYLSKINNTLKPRLDAFQQKWAI